MVPERAFPSLATRAVAVVTSLLSREQFLGGEAERVRAIMVFDWLDNHLQDRGSDALQDLKVNPGLADNQADLRKQLVRFLEKEPTAADDLFDLLRGVDDDEQIETVIRNVGNALHVANNTVGIFKRRND
jgi:hypothetical protein